MPFVQLPLADFWEAVGPLLVFVFWILQQVFSASKEEDIEEEKPARRVRIGEDGEIIEEAVDPTQPKSIDDFLREIGATEEPAAGVDQAENEAEVMPSPVAMPARPIDPFEEPPRRKPKQRSQPDRQRTERSRQQRSPKRDQTPPAEKSTKRQRVNQQKLPDGQLTERSSHLGETIASADDRIDARLHQKFDHQLGNLDESDGGEAKSTKKSERLSKPTTSMSAKNLRDLLSSPSGMRDAIILNEILTRPSDRWD